MARNDIPRTDHYVQSTEDARRLGDVRCGTQVQDAPSISYVDIELTRKFGNSVLAGALEPERTNSKPPKPEHNPEQINICHTLFTRHGICESTREHRNTQKVQTTSIEGLTHTGERRTRSRTASHPQTPDNPLDTRMDHTTPSMDT